MPEQKNDNFPPYEGGMLMRMAIVLSAVLTLYIILYFFSTLEDQFSRRIQEPISRKMSNLVFGSSKFESFKDVYHIPYLQLALAYFFTIPASFFACKSIVVYEYQRAENVPDGAFNHRLAMSLFFLLTALILFLPPSRVYIGSSASAFFGALSPLRYGLSAFFFGYTLRSAINSTTSRRYDAR